MAPTIPCFCKNFDFLLNVLPCTPTFHSLRQMETIAERTQRMESDAEPGKCFSQKAKGL